MKSILMKLMCAALFFSSLYSKDVAITVYNQNRALVREQRQLNIQSGVSTISFSDVAARIDPTSVHFKSITAADKLNILEQNFEYDLVSADKILEKYVDESIQLITTEGDVYSGTLLSASGSDIVLGDRDGGIKIIKGQSVQYFDFPELPDGLITRPTLVWLIRNSGPETHKTEISYMTSGVDWHAEYVAVTDSKDKNLDLSGWVSVNNRSGATYEQAKIKLVAGDVNVVQPQAKRMERTMDLMAVTSESGEQFEEKSFFEYHLYTLQRKATLKNNQIKQISLFPPASTAVQKIFIYDGARYQNKVRVHLEFKNSKNKGLGLPLPKGKIRVYKQDDDGALEFIGEDQIDHTPKDETIQIYLGNAFDLVGERIQKHVQKLSKRSREEKYEITLKNHKNEDVDIVVREHFWGDWTIQQKTHQFDKTDARTAEFSVHVPSDEEVVVSYSVILSW